MYALEILTPNFYDMLHKFCTCRDPRFWLLFFMICFISFIHVGTRDSDFYFLWYTFLNFAHTYFISFAHVGIRYSYSYLLWYVYKFCTCRHPTFWLLFSMICFINFAHLGTRYSSSYFLWYAFQVFLTPKTGGGGPMQTLDILMLKRNFPNFKVRDPSK